MIFHNEPVNGEDLSNDYHWHIAFYPPMGSAEKVQYNFSSETGNPACLKEPSKELREAYERFPNK